MIPKTINKMCPFEVMSAMQKHIRRGEEREAMHCACELGHSSKHFFSMMCNRLEVIMHEDIGLASPETVCFAAAAVTQARNFYKGPGKHGEWRIIVGNAIRLMCRSPKSREGDHFQAAVGQHAYINNVAPEIPEYAYDHHTRKGRKMGRDISHFRKVSAKLVPKPKKKDEYEDEAYEVWRGKEEPDQLF